MGLYDTDVHYYLTYFLALAAGLTEQQAWIIATADQTLDNVNLYTDAFPSKEASGNWDARELYHFTQVSTDWNPNNDQILRLHGYYVNASGDCLKLQFYGEYMHAFEDTYGHRDRNNEPYSAYKGHPEDFHNPDMTYNHQATIFWWWNNEDRTLKMEQAVFKQLQEDWGTSAKDKDGNAITFESIRKLMIDWNAIWELGDLKPESDKLTKLNKKLKDEFGLPEIQLYDKYVGLGCRLKYLGDAGLVGTDGMATDKGKTNYPKAILDTTKDGAAECAPPK
jgi:hypothetical protein